jgi:hypothetical protein
MTWDNSETLSTVLYFDPVHFRISGKKNPEKNSPSAFNFSEKDNI